MGYTLLFNSQVSNQFQLTFFFFFVKNRVGFFFSFNCGIEYQHLSFKINKLKENKIVLYAAPHKFMMGWWLKHMLRNIESKIWELRILLGGTFLSF